MIKLHTVLQKVSKEAGTPLIHSGCDIETSGLSENAFRVCATHNAWVCWCGAEVESAGDFCWKHQNPPHYGDDGIEEI